MNILFWNLCKHQNVKVIQELLAENEVDVALFCEYTETGVNNLVKSLGTNYFRIIGFGGCKKITMLARKPSISSAIIRREQARFAIYSLRMGNDRYLLAGVHLEDQRSYSEATRINTAHSIVDTVEEQEKALKIDKSIIIGDFNANPYSTEMIAKVSFNSVIFRSMMDAESISFEGKRKRRLYNPILQFLRDEDGKRGSYYYSSNDTPLYWNAYDQVLMNKQAMISFLNMEYITSTSRISLMSRKGPNKTYSDHLPLLVKFERGNNDE